MTDRAGRSAAMVGQIAARPELEMVSFRTGPPITDAALARVEAHLGAPLAPPLREFHRQHDGLTLRWKARAGLPEDVLDELDERYGDDGDIGLSADDDPDDPFAGIDILPLEGSLITRGWRGVVWFPDVDGDEPLEFAGQPYREADPLRSLRPFDLFSTCACAAFLLRPREGDLPVVLLGDHYIEWDHTRVTDFASYLEMLLATRGIGGFRSRTYGRYRGDREPPLRTPASYWTPERLPLLFRGDERRVLP